MCRSVQCIVKLGSELCFGVRGRVRGYAPSIVFEDLESLAGIVGEGVDGRVGVKETEAGCSPIQGCV